MKKLIPFLAIVSILFLAGCSSYREVKTSNEVMICPQLNLPAFTLEENQFEKGLFSPSPSIGIGSQVSLPKGIVVDEDELNSISCKTGSKEGEQANRYYCNPWYLKKLVTKSDGTISKEEKFIVLMEFNQDKKVDSTKCYKN